MASKKRKKQSQPASPAESTAASRPAASPHQEPFPWKIALLLARPGFRLALAGSLALLFATLLGSPWVAAGTGAVLASGLAVQVFVAGGHPAIPRLPGHVPGPRVWAPVLLGCAAVAAWLGRGKWLPGLEWTWNQVVYYQAWATEDTQTAAFFGGVAELTKLPPSFTAQLLAGHWLAAGLGTVGFGLLLWHRPLAAVFLPLGGIALAAFFLGARFTLFSASFFGLGLGCGLLLAMHRLGPARAWRWAAFVVLAPAVFLYPWIHARAYVPEPMVTQRFARNLIEAGPAMPDDALLWNRWDVGAAVNYYARRRSVEMALANLGIYSQAMAQVDKKAARELILRRAKDRDQYVIVDWQGMGTLETLLRTGTFDRSAGKSAKTDTVRRLVGRFFFDLDQGTMIAPDQRIPLRTLGLIEPLGLRGHSWPDNAQGGNVILDADRCEGFMMGPDASAAMYTRLLFQTPQLFAPEFELVLDDFPWMRIYRVVPD